MMRKLNRNYSLSVVVPFVVILTLLIAAAVLAQTPSADRPSGQANAVLAPVGTSAPAQVERPLTPWTDGAGGSPVSHSQTKRHGARPMDGNPLFLGVVDYDSAGNGTCFVAVADVNGDGKPDVVVSNGNGTVGVLLGNGDGTFQPAVTFNPGLQSQAGIALADLNGDGKPDLLVANASGVAVLLGNGDGTFQPAVTYGSGGSSPWSVAVADVNRDGKPDLIVANYSSSTVGVLLGNGDGTFQPAATYGSGGNGPWSVAVADVNGDGNPDLLVVNVFDNTVGVLLGNGDGTFQAAVTYSSGGGFRAPSIAVADLNGDGKPDLAVANDCGGCDGSVAVLLGNGDGTFRPAVLYDSGGDLTLEVAIADVNGDGKPDLIVLNTFNYYTANISVPLGTGDGTLQPALTYGSGAMWVYSIVVADVNGDGEPDLVVGNETLSGGDGSVGVLLHTTPTTTTLVSSLNPSVYGQAVTFTAAVSAASGTPTGTVIFYDGSTSLGSATLANGSASLSTSTLAVGSHSITAAYQGVGAFLPSTSVPL